MHFLKKGTDSTIEDEDFLYFLIHFQYKMSDEIQVIDMQHINNQTSFLSKLKLKMQQGYKINLVFQKVFNFNQSAPQSDRKNEKNQHYQNKSQIQVQEEILISPDNFEQFIQQGPCISLNQIQQIDGDNTENIQHDAIELGELKSHKTNKSFLRKKQHIEAKIAAQQLENKLNDLNKKFDKDKGQFEFYEESYQQILIQCKEIEEQEGKLLELPLKKKLWVMRVECQVQRALCFKKMLKLQEAIKILEFVIKRYAINEPELFTKLLLELASLNYECYNFTRSLDYYSKLLRLYEKLNWKVDICFVLSEMAIEEAKRLAYEALDIGQSQMVMDDFRLSNCYDALGTVFFLNKEYLFSIELLQKGLKIKNIVNRYTENYFSKTKTHNLLGQAYLITCLSTKAISQFKQALELIKKTDYNLVKAKILINLGIALSSHGDLKDGQAAFREAFKIQKIVLRDQHPILKRTKTHLSSMKKLQTFS